MAFTLSTRSPILLWAGQLLALVVLVWQTDTATHLTLTGFRHGPGWSQRLRPPVEETIFDFFQEWGSAQNWRTGQPIYAAQEETIPLYLGVNIETVDYHGIHFNAHPPTMTMLALPLGAWSYLNALLVWHLVTLFGLVLSAWLVLREHQIAPRRSWWRWVLPGLAVLSFWTPLRDQFLQGQLTGVLLPLLVGVWVADRRGRPGLAGALLGVATVIKLFPAFLLLYFVWRRQWRAVVLAAVLASALTLVTVLVLGLTAYQDYLTTVLPTLKPFRSSLENQSIVGFWHRLFVGHPTFSAPLWYAPWLAWALTFATALTLIALCVQTLRRTPVAEQDRVFWLFVIVMVQLGPVTWAHSPLLLSVPLAYLLVTAWQTPHRAVRWATALLVAFYFLDHRTSCLAFAELGWLPYPVVPLASVTIGSLHCYFLLLFFVLYRRTLPQTTPYPLDPLAGPASRMAPTEPRPIPCVPAAS